MIRKVYSVLDSKTGSYITPIFAINDAVAIRSFQAAVMDPRTDFSRFAEDYSLHALGQFDDATGQFVNLSAPVTVITGAFLRAQVMGSELPNTKEGN